MAAVVYAEQHDTVDAICHRAFGYTRQVVEQTLAANPGLASLGPELPPGTRVVLPDQPAQPQTAQTVNLWD